MNNLRLLTGLLSIALSSGGVCAYGQSVVTLEEIFESAETNSAQLRPSFTAQTEAEREISIARSGHLPDINAKLSSVTASQPNAISVTIRKPRFHISARKVLQEMRARYEHGTALLNDITRYELLVSNFELQLIRINNTIGILNANLVTTAGLPEGTVIVPDSTILARSLPKESTAWWQTEAEANSPSLSLARSRVDISRKTESLVRSERLPKIGLQAGWSMDGPILVEVPPINRNLSYWYVGIGVSYNISSLYKSNKSLARSRIAAQKTMEQLESTWENVSLAVNADHVRYLEAYEELKTQQKSVELAEKNYRTTSTRYSADMALITDMLDAANSKLDAEQRLVNARINIIYYYYKLLFTTGKI